MAVDVSEVALGFKFSRLISGYVNDETYPKYNQGFDDVIATDRDIILIKQNAHQLIGLLFLISKTHILMLRWDVKCFPRPSFFYLCLLI